MRSTIPSINFSTKLVVLILCIFLIVLVGIVGACTSSKNKDNGSNGSAAVSQEPFNSNGDNSNGDIEKTKLEILREGIEYANLPGRMAALKTKYSLSNEQTFQMIHKLDNQRNPPKELQQFLPPKRKSKH